jgi:hypothetical protein
MMDLRLPIGVFFLIVGVLLLLTPASAAAMDSGAVNQYTGICSLAFGGFMAGLAWRKRH